MTLKGENNGGYMVSSKASNIRIGKHCRFRKNVNINANSGGTISIGNGVFINNGCSFNARSSIIVEDGVLFGENVCLYDHNHQFADRTKAISQQGYNCDRIIIGKNCWICSNVTILKGVTIGEGCIIGANCLIYKDIPSFSIVRNNSTIEVIDRK